MMATHRYVCTACIQARKGASEAPRTHFRACKILKFPQGVPQTPLTQSILWAPLFVFVLGYPNPLSGPEPFLHQKSISFRLAMF